MTFVKLGEIADFINGRAFKPAEWENTGLPIIRIQNLNDQTKPFNYTASQHHDKYYVASNDILFSWSGTPGTSFGCFRWDREPGWLNQHIFNVKFFDDNSISGDFFIRAVNSQLDRIIDQAHGGVGLKHITKKKLLEITIPLPPLDEQKRIAGILDAADELRAKRRQTLLELDTLIQSTFLDLFGDPVTNPKGWEFKTMNDLIVSGPQNGIYKPANLYGSGTRILRIDGFYDGALTGETLLKRVLVSQKEVDLYALSEGDIVINRVNSPEYLGKCALIPPLEEAVIFESNMMRMSIDPTTTNGRYLVQALQSKHVKNQILTSSKDAVNQSSINQKDVGAFRVPLPPYALQQQFADIVEKIEAQKSRCQAHLDELDTLFTSLQSKAFKGEL